SGIVASKSGVWLNNELDDFSFTLKDSNAFGLAGSQANLFRPGARPVSSMTPTIVVKKGKPILVVGSPGGTRIPTAVFQVAWRKVVGKSSLLQAVDAPRLHHQAFPDEVWVEAGNAARRWSAGLQKMGHKVIEKPAWCNVQAVAATAKGRGYEAVSDGRYDGSAYAK
ncbi:MAG TPA: gamma-glutamyltransferase, partial [Myxococcales bacterium]|nr:gamma-glutamyltransferase [Myxococcales bacterium]HAN30179.1 gamma-glutamyltransferase [Myxococcales bacterium]